MSAEGTFLKELFDVAIQASHPYWVLPPHLPQDRSGPALVIAAGKAAAAMAHTFEQHWSGPIRGLAVTRYGHGDACQYIEVVEAAHPVPDAAGQQAAQRVLALVQQARRDEHVFLLLSGGGSSLLNLPAEGITADDKTAINRALLRCGATIEEINCVRKHLSAIKGGRLALAAAPTPIHTLAISDVAGDDPSVIASGPSVADPTTSSQALAVLHTYGVDVPPQVSDWLHKPESETPKPGSFVAGPYQLIATPQQALQAAAAHARACGITPLLLGDRIEGEARDVAKVMAGIALSVQDHGEPLSTPCVILSGGETSVTLKGHGRGGRNTEFLLSLTHCLRGRPGIYALAADTDGIDGSEDNAGAQMGPATLTNAQKLGLNAEAYLNDNNSYAFFSALGDLLVTGPTRTNVNDFRAILVK